MKNKLFSPIILCFLLSSTVFSQGVLIPENFDELNDKIEKIKFRLSRSQLKSRHTLERFLHYSHNQEGPSCVAHAITTCRSILYARDNNLSNVNEISLESFSPSYTYLNCKEPSGGMILDIESINSKGFYKIKKFEYPNYFPFSKKNILKYEFLDSLKEEGIRYKFAKCKGIDISHSNNLKVKEIKQELLSNNPALVSFYWSNEKKSPIKGKNDSITGHSVVLIGYDDNKNGGSFLYFNSHGDDFGINGKDWISYKDFFKSTRVIYFFYTNEIEDYSYILEPEIMDKSGAISSSNETIGYNKVISFNWAIRMPILSKIGTYTGDTTIDGKRNGFGEFLTMNNASYIGEWKNDIPFGNGTAKLNEDYSYTAFWGNNFKLPELHHSVLKSLLTIKNDTVTVIEFYDGEFKGPLSRNNFHGNGTLIRGNKKYVGEWENGKENGKGIDYYSNGARYEGEWENGKKNGKGIIYTKDGNKYEEGEWLKGKKNGKFFIYTTNGDIYKVINYKNGLEIK